MVAEISCPLAGGLWRDGARETAAAVRPLTGADEVRVADNGRAATPAAAATALLASATHRIGRIEAPGAAELRALSVGDRERLLLALYRASFGPRIQAVARCSRPDCDATMELELEVEELLAPVRDETPSGVRGPLDPATGGEARAARGSEYELAAGEDGGRIRFRLPNGDDQERAARLATSDPGAAAALILERCVLAASDAADAPVDSDSAPSGWSARLGEAFEALDPQASIELGLTCPECGGATRALLDAAGFLLAELDRGDGVFAEVDRLARAYHWSEAEILALPVGRRRRYLALVAEG